MLNFETGLLKFVRFVGRVSRSLASDEASTASLSQWRCAMALFKGFVRGVYWITHLLVGALRYRLSKG